MLAVVYEIMVVSTDFSKCISCGSFIVRKGLINKVIVSPYNMYYNFKYVSFSPVGHV